LEEVEIVMLFSVTGISESQKTLKNF